MTESTSPTYRHDSPNRTGVLLVNLGTPDAPDRAAVRRYLREFLSDPRVVEVPRPIWWLILHGFILNTRPSRSAKAYQKIWTTEGSPLLAISRRQCAALAGELARREGDGTVVELAMRYGTPSIESALESLRDAGAQRLQVLPLYPQYSATTTASIFDAVCGVLRHWRWLPELRFINHYHDDPGYIDALANSVRQHRSEFGGADKLLLSFHGIPQAYFDKGDPYFCECQKTARLLGESLGLAADDWLLTFQSRLGRKPWLSPYTDLTLKALAEQGVNSVQVMCPGFSADCLETLEEVAMENRELFLAAGGSRYEYIPCLNDSEPHISFLADLIQRHCQGWSANATDTPESVLRHAKGLGATC